MVYQKSAYYERLAAEVINAMPELHFIAEMNVSIAYLESSKSKKSRGKAVCGDCEKVKDKNKTFMPYDFIITIYEPNVRHMNKQQLKILLWHELLHVGAEQKDDGVHMSIRPHDFEDFDCIVSRFGNWWNAEGAEPEDITAGTGE